MHQDLSPQEREVVALVALGLSNKRIARKLHLAESTVKNYLANAMYKTQVENRTAMAIWWRDHEEDAEGAPEHPNGYGQTDRC